MHINSSLMKGEHIHHMVFQNIDIDHRSSFRSLKGSKGPPFPSRWNKHLTPSLNQGSYLSELCILGRTDWKKQGCRTEIDPVRNTWKLLSSENITFLHCADVQGAYFFANAIRCFSMRSFISGFVATLRHGGTKSFCNRYLMVRTAMFCSSPGCKFSNSSAVSRGFFFNPLVLMTYVPADVFLRLPPPNLSIGLMLEADASSLNMVDFTRPARSYIVFIGTFSCLHARI